jgi:membrane-bound metal-dependent hydrolase YbcI (DUF457 family)
MWPWEHLAVGYLLYSAYVHLRTGGPPTDAPALLLAGTTQFPDLVDKPLAWTFDVFSDGTALAHSIFVAVPIVALAVALDRGRSPRRYAPAVAIGYLSHLLADAAYPLLAGGGSFAVSVMLWPLVPGGDSVTGFVSKFGDLFVDFLFFLATPRGLAYLSMELLLVGGAVALWARDGRPGLEPLVAPVLGRAAAD